MKLYRVLPFVRSAADDEPGGVFFRPPGGHNRIDSPTRAYRVLYAGSHASGAIAEAFGRFDTWDAELIEAYPATPLVPNSRFALVTHEIDRVAICDLDDPQALVTRKLRPSQVVTRDRVVTQTWVAAIHATGSFNGIGWWSYYDAGWNSIGLWDISGLHVATVPRTLTLRDADVALAAATIVRKYAA